MQNINDFLDGLEEKHIKSCPHCSRATLPLNRGPCRL
jgi:hypothetical protein